MEEKLSLPFVNKGKPFTVSNWTVEKHEKTLSLMVEKNKSASAKELDALFRYYVVLVGLQDIDDSVTMEQVRSLHVENIMELFDAIYYAGKIDIFFHQSDKKKTQENK